MVRFKKIYIEIVNVCNLACSFCPGTSREPLFMSPVRFEKVLSAISRRTEHLYFHVMGEPLLHPDISDLFDISAAQGFKVNLTTNGTLLGKTGGMLLAKSALRQVSVSLHSFEANDCGFSPDEYLEGVVGFALKAHDNGRPIVSLRLWNTSADGRNDRNEYIVSKLCDTFKPGLSPDALPLGGRGVKLADNIYLNTAPVFSWPSIAKEELGGEGFCLGLRDQIGILADGTVIPCCLDAEGAIKLGNIFEQDLDAILHGERAEAIYRGFSGRKAVERLCRNCGYRSRFS